LFPGPAMGGGELRPITTATGLAGAVFPKGTRDHWPTFHCD
jgi:hypothetical protein